MKSSLPLFALLSLLASCASPPVWRSPAYGPEHPVPTLAAASVWEFAVPEEPAQEIVVPEGAKFDFGDFAKGVVDYAKDNPEKIAEAAAKLVEQKRAIEAANRTVAAAAPAMHEDVMRYLVAQGFTVEFDAARSAKLVGGGTVAGEYAYVQPSTAARPFDTFPMFGPGSKSWILERLRTARSQEAYASVHANFQAEDNRIDRTVSCVLSIVVLDQAGEQVFGAKASGTATPSGAPDQTVATVQQALQAALANMSKPEILK